MDGMNPLDISPQATHYRRIGTLTHVSIVCILTHITVIKQHTHVNINALLLTNYNHT